MPQISQHQSSTVTKLLFIGITGTGKTGALASLAAAGYHLRIADFDNGLDILRDYCTNPSSPYVKQNPKIAENIHFITLTDPMKIINGNIVPIKAQAWDRFGKLLTNWEDGETKFGNITSWTDKDVLVIDSLDQMATAALNFHMALQGALGQVRTGYDYQRDIGMAQNYVRKFLEVVKDVNLKCNIIVNSHLAYVDEPGQSQIPRENRLQQAFPSAIGKALSPHIGEYFNSCIQAKTVGSGSSTRHKIFTVSQGVVNLKTSAPLKVAPEYPLESGLADYFKAVRQ